MNTYVIVGGIVAFSIAIIGILASVGPRSLRRRIRAFRAQHRIALIVIVLVFMVFWLAWGIYLSLTPG